MTEADGDMDKAIDFLRERGLAAAEKKSARIAAEGVVYTYYDEAAKKAVTVEVNSETDFVAKNDKFMNFVKGVARTIIATAPADVEALCATAYDGTDRTVTETLNDLILSIGENMKIRRFEVMDGVVATYIHAGGSVGVMVGFDVADESKAATDEFKVMGKDVAMQIAAMSPSYLDEASVPAEVIEHEKGILSAQLKEDPKMANKPEQVLEKIAAGKLGKFYKENCLVDQEFVKAENHENVQTYINNVAKALGTEIKCTGFVRMMKGEGLEKREENFAEEIAKQINLYAMMRYNRIVWDFMVGVIGEKFRSQDFEFSRKDLNVFFSHLQEQNDDIAGWSESTVNKIKQVLTKILVEVEILDTFKSTRLNPLFLCEELEEGIRRNNDLEALAAFNCFR